MSHNERIAELQSGLDDMLVRIKKIEEIVEKNLKGTLYLMDRVQGK